MEYTLFSTLIHAAFVLAGTVAFVVWGFSGFPMFVVKFGRK